MDLYKKFWPVGIHPSGFRMSSCKKKATIQSIGFHHSTWVNMCCVQKYCWLSKKTQQQQKSEIIIPITLSCKSTMQDFSYHLSRSPRGNGENKNEIAIELELEAQIWIASHHRIPNAKPFRQQVARFGNINSYQRKISK